MQIKSLVILIFILLISSGCASPHHIFDSPYHIHDRAPDYYLEKIIEKGQYRISFIVKKEFVENSGRNPDEVIIEVLESSLKKVTLCPDGYIIDRKIRFENLNHGLILDCK